jgi:hypothetical protein
VSEEKASDVSTCCFGREPGQVAFLRESLQGGRHLGCGRPCLPFAREHGGRPSKERWAQVRRSGRDRSREAHHRRAAPLRHFPHAVGHGFVTWGARACQVGVNPPRRAVAVVGVDAVSKPSDPWPEEARLASDRKGCRHSAEGGLPPRLPEIGRCAGVLGERSVAEAGRRHVAPRPR